MTPDLNELEPTTTEVVIGLVSGLLFMSVCLWGMVELVGWLVR